MVNNAENRVTLIMESRSANVAFARVAATAFLAPLDPTVGELSDIKTAVSEAVTNAVIHGYGDGTGEVRMILVLEGRNLIIEVIDDGVGIENVSAAREPLFTTKPELERSGLGFTVMESFMDQVEVYSVPGQGTTVIMSKVLKA